MQYLQIEHVTRHTYDAPVTFSNHALFLRPMDNHRRHVRRFEVATQPPSQQRWVRDVHGNTVLQCVFGLVESPVLEFRVTIDVGVDPENPYDFILESYATGYPFRYNPVDSKSLGPFLDTTTMGASLRVLDWLYHAVEQPVQHPDVVAFLSSINEALWRDIAYERRDEEGIQSPDLTLQRRKGSCRDVAVLFIAILRQLGIAARFVSGYLYDPATGEAGEHVFNRAVGSMHAWAEVYLPGAGWKGFDPTNGILANEYFIPCAVSDDPAAVDPIQGTYFASKAVRSTMEVSLKIEPAPPHSPEATKADFNQG